MKSASSDTCTPTCPTINAFRKPNCNVKTLIPTSPQYTDNAYTYESAIR